MAFPCCMGLYDGLRMANLGSLILSLAVLISSGWVLNDTYEFRNSPEFKMANSIWDMYRKQMQTVGDGYGGGYGQDLHSTLLRGQMGQVAKLDPDKILKIRLAIAAAVFAASVLQFFTTVVFFVHSSFKETISRLVVKFYISLNTLIWLTICLALLCVMICNIGKLDKLMALLVSSVIDFLFLIYLIIVAYFYARSLDS